MCIVAEQKARLLQLMVAEALSTLAGGMMSWEWIHRLKQNAVNLSKSLFCAGCSLAPLKNLEQAL